jgi:hypothetical protein
MASVARLAVARGLPYAAVEEMLKLAFVHAAADAHPGLLAHRKVSRISTSTGINRREVTRLTQAQPRAQTRSRSLVSEMFTHWRTHGPYRGRDRQPKVLPRQGPAPSFESLAQLITRDVHPRSLLDELCRLGLATWDEAADTVALSREVFVPHGDGVRQLGFLSDNVGDHLRAAVENVLGDSQAHFEQAVYARGLTAASLEAMRPAIRVQWRALLDTLVPALRTAADADSELQPVPTGRMRIGLYSYQEAPAAVDAAESPAAPPVRRRAAPRKT